MVEGGYSPYFNNGADSHGSRGISESTMLHDMILAAGLSDIGCKRAANEDRILVDREQLLFAVADGMGGERCGGRAAELATRALAEYFRSPASELNSSNLSDQSGTLQATQDRMATAIRLANDRILQESATIAECSGMGCTVSALAINGDVATVGSVGDSRVYLFRGGQLIQLTRDDSIVMELLDSGAIIPEQTRSHPLRNVLTQSVGTKESVEIQIIEFALASRDRLLISSDGLHGILTDTVIREILASTDELQDVARDFVAAARELGGPDNISCIVIECLQ